MKIDKMCRRFYVLLPVLSLGALATLEFGLSEKRTERERDKFITINTPNLKSNDSSVVMQYPMRGVGGKTKNLNLSVQCTFTLYPKVMFLEAASHYFFYPFLSLILH